MLRVILILTLLFASLVQVSCQTNDKKSVLIIAVDKLAISDVNCNQETESGIQSGILTLCKESVRFTHAYTTSTMSVSALASLLTGLYPFEHKVRHNGGPGLAPELELSSEIAIKNNYRTSFFSGGAPVFRRSGLHQGFELFDDNFNPQLNALFRSFKKASFQFIQWLKAESMNSAFFTVIYVPDLSFTTNITTTNLGETRNLSFESQLDDFKENLFALIQQIKKLGRWDDTTVILVGLNGHNIDERLGELEPTNLHSENTQVALLVKLATTKKRDEAIYWKIDQNVSLADVGRTLFDLLGEDLTDKKENQDFPIHSLTSTFNKPMINWSEDRNILIESGWPIWRDLGSLKTAAISSHILYINNASPLLYNTLLDRLEVNPLPLLQESILPTTKSIRDALQSHQFLPFSTHDSDWKINLSLPFTRWMKPEEEPLLLRDLKQLSKTHPNNMNLVHWTGQIALNLRDWETLKELGLRYKIANWQYVAEKNLIIKGAHTSDPCFELLGLHQLESSNLKKCSDPLFLEMIDWVRSETRSLLKETQKKKFERSYKYQLLDQITERTNIALALNWDTNLENSFSPSRTQLALNLPELSKIRAALNKSIINAEDF